jgi:hypothetical protein
LCGAETWTLRLTRGQKYIEVLKWGAVEGWRRSVEPLVREIRKYYKESRKK